MSQTGRTGNFAKQDTPSAQDVVQSPSVESAVETPTNSDPWGDRPSIEVLESYEENLLMRDPFRVKNVPPDRQGIWHTKEQEPAMRAKYFIPGYEGDGGMHYHTVGEKNLENQKKDRISRGNLVFSHRPIEFSMREQKKLMEESLKQESIPDAIGKSIEALRREHPEIEESDLRSVFRGENESGGETVARPTPATNRSIYAMPHNPLSRKK